MITLYIGSDRRQLSDVSEGWIEEQLKRRRAKGENVCVRVDIRTPEIDMGLSTPACRGLPGGRLPTVEERRPFDLWDGLRLNSNAFAPENLIKFLRPPMRRR